MPPHDDDIEEFELAFARLDWVRAANCLNLPSQREALEWHLARCEVAYAAVALRAEGERA